MVCLGLCWLRTIYYLHVDEFLGGKGEMKDKKSLGREGKECFYLTGTTSMHVVSLFTVCKLLNSKNLQLAAHSTLSLSCIEYLLSPPLPPLHFQHSVMFADGLWEAL